MRFFLGPPLGVAFLGDLEEREYISQFVSTRSVRIFKAFFDGPLGSRAVGPGRHWKTKQFGTRFDEIRRSTSSGDPLMSERVRHFSPKKSGKSVPRIPTSKTDRVHQGDGKSRWHAWSETPSWGSSDDTIHKKDRTRIRGENIFIILRRAKN
ncbi:hypothetical protein TNCV_1506631 [Trichonephila clavipes]|nr:hypothetical protein TNCV_1506631 [Trichonephila clavipes]